MKTLRNIIYIGIACFLAACSTTSHLPEGEMLYTGVKKMKVHNQKRTAAEDLAVQEVKAALAYKPNGSLLGSSSKRSPFQVGLWIYNAYVDKPRTGFNKWMFNSFAGTPVTISSVSPETRTKVATNILQNYGYFRGGIDYSLINQRNPRKQRISYDIYLGEPYLYDSIRYAFRDSIQDSILRATEKEAYLHKGDQFSTLNLTNEKDRIVSAFRDNGLYYYRPDYINYFADSTNIPYRVKLLVASDLDLPEQAFRQVYFGNTNVYIRKSRALTSNQRRRQRGTEVMNDSLQQQRRRTAEMFDDSIQHRRLKIAYQGNRIPIAPRVVLKNFKFHPREMFNQSNVDKTLTNLHRMDIFSNVRFTFIPRDTTGVNDTIDTRLDLTMDQLIEAETEFSFTHKSNSQIGPGGGITLSKRNAFRHGETLSVGLRGSYEWTTRKMYGEEERINSYLAALDLSLSYPWIAFPWLNKRFYKYPTSTEFKITLEQRKRAYFYRLMASTIEATYDFQTSRSWSHRLTPLTVTYNKMQNTTDRFESTFYLNQALYLSLQDVFIPAQQYTITYDNTWNSRVRHTMHFEGTVKQAGNFLNITNAFLGFPYHKKDKLLLSTPYAQFLKFNFQLKNIFHITEKTSIATRVQVGAIWTYGNCDYAPYSELFYVGGANSIRAFTIRSIGPGRFRDDYLGIYLAQTGDIKLEMNAEYRFPIINAFQGALFLDAGNVWLMRDDFYQVGGKLGDGGFFNTLAVGTGFGLRYDLDFLILRLDLGVGIHIPYDTGKSSYYNIPKFKDSTSLHFAVGYPF